MLGRCWRWCALVLIVCAIAVPATAVSAAESLDEADPSLGGLILGTAPEGYEPDLAETLPARAMTPREFTEEFGDRTVGGAPEGSVIYGAVWVGPDAGAAIVVVGLSAPGRGMAKGFVSGVISGAKDQNGTLFDVGIADTKGFEAESGTTIGFARNGRGFMVFATPDTSRAEVVTFTRRLVTGAEALPVREATAEEASVAYLIGTLIGFVLLVLFVVLVVRAAVRSQKKKQPPPGMGGGYPPQWGTPQQWNQPPYPQAAAPPPPPWPQPR